MMLNYIGHGSTAPKTISFGVVLYDDACMFGIESIPAVIYATSYI